MTSFAAQIKEANVDNIHRVVQCNDEKYLCFTRLATTWFVSVTDGVTLWRVDLDDEEVDALRDLAGINTVEAYLTRFRNGFSSGDVSVAVIGNKVALAVGKGSSILNFDLYEAKAADKRTEMQKVLFRLAESATSMESDLSKAKQTIDALKAQKGAANTAAFMDLGPKKGANPAKNKPKKTGMSVLNPTSKKRKAAHGVVFD